MEMIRMGKSNSVLPQKDEETCIAIFRSVVQAHHRLHRLGSSIAADFGLHIAQLNVIDMLGKLGSITMGELSRATFISASNTTHTIKKLENTGLVKRRRSAASDRKVLVSLTEKGEQLFSECYPRILKAVDGDLKQNLNARERATLASLLGKLAT
jgi:DNA-binding MarR family transcriptional regulator